MSGYYGSPFPLAKGAVRGSSLEKFERWARQKIEHDENYRARVAWLHGKKLVCFCAPQPCHGDILAKLAAELQ